MTATNWWHFLFARCCLGKCPSRGDPLVQWGSWRPVCSQWKTGNLRSTALGSPLFCMPRERAALDLCGGEAPFFQTLCLHSAGTQDGEMDAGDFWETCQERTGHLAGWLGSKHLKGVPGSRQPLWYLKCRVLSGSVQAALTGPLCLHLGEARIQNSSATFEEGTEPREGPGL